MPESIEIADLVAGPSARGSLRIDHRLGPDDGPNSRPTLVLLGGMTQTLASWSAHLRPMSARRSVLAYEARGQGHPALSLADCGFAQHVRDFEALLDACGLHKPVDLAGFSFGGRVSLAIAAKLPHRVRRLVLGGVALTRGVVGDLIVASWHAALQTGDLEALARVSLPDILGPAYLEAHAAHVDGMIRAAQTRNDYAGIRALFEHTLGREDGAYQPDTLAGAIRCPMLAVGGSLDRIAPASGVRALAERCGGKYVCLEGAGHTVPIEQPQVWRDAVERFLDADFPQR